MTKVELRQLEKMANEKGMPVQDFIRAKLFPSRKEYTPLLILLRQVREGIVQLEIDDKFSIPDFFTDEQWERLTVGDRLRLGRAFKRMIDSGDIDNVTFEGKTSANLAVYRRSK